MDPFRIIRPQGSRVPIVLSVPHSGTEFPREIADQFRQEPVANPDDTDWFVDKLYDFAPRMGITMIVAVYSRYIIDLNRDSKEKPLYNDGRLITGLCPVTDFLGNNLYRDNRTQVTPEEIRRRTEKFYTPYHSQIERLLSNTREEFGKTLLWDCHSIRRKVPTISKDPFPDIILGSVDGTSASPGLIETALSALDHSNYSVAHNRPFKGGTITRSFGRPTDGYHALQLEMSKDVYMDDAEESYQTERAGAIRLLLERTLDTLANQLAS